MNLLEHRPCPNCDAPGGAELVSFPADLYPHERFDTASWDGQASLPMRIVRCACGLVRTDPAFKEDALGHVYPEKLVDVVAQVARLDAVFKAEPKFVRMAEHVRRFLPEGATLIDVGARYGVFPWLAKTKYGLDAYGIELNKAAVEVGRHRFDGLWCSTVGGLREVLRQHGKPERVNGFVLDDVLEHLVHPGRDLDLLHALQEPGDLLFLRQMDMDSMGRRIFGSRWYYFQPAAHMFYFDEASVRRLLDRHGYEVIDVTRPSRALQALKTLVSIPKQLLRGRRARRAPLEKRPLYLTQRLRGDDDMFLVTARKR